MSNFKLNKKMENLQVLELSTEIKKLLVNTLPKKTHIQVWERKNVFSDGYYIAVMFSVSDYQINGVKGQYCQNVSLSLNCDTMELKVQIYGGEGGNCIYRKPNLDDTKERFLYMKSVKVPFKQPKKELKFVLSSIERFGKNWVQVLKENREVLMYQQYINYDEFFES